MDFEELQRQVDELKAQGLKDEDILKIFYEAFASGEVEAGELEKMAQSIGYKFSPEFEQELTKEAQAQGLTGGEGEAPNGELSQEEIDDTKQLKDGESPEEFKEKIEDINKNGENSNSEDEEEGEDDEEESEDEDEDDEDEPEDEEDEEEKAMKMFGFKK